jgi:protein-S-isoprenylcysteine O-methyltransferase Ste14
MSIEQANLRGPAAPLTRHAILLDTGERLVVAAVFASFVYRMLFHAVGGVGVQTALLVMAETLPFIYVVLRAPSVTLSQRPWDWAFGIMGTIMPLFVMPAVNLPPLLPGSVCVAVMLGGMTLQVAAKLILGRSFGIIPANRGVRVVGPYRFIRHPMYAGYTLTHIGFLLAMPSAINAALYGLAFSFQVSRIFREERVLFADPGYRAFAERVRYRLVPGLF